MPLLNGPLLEGYDLQIILLQNTKFEWSGMNDKYTSKALKLNLLLTKNKGKFDQQRLLNL